MLKFTGSIIWRLGTRSTFRKYSSFGATVLRNEKSHSSQNVPIKGIKTAGEEDSSGLVAAAFASLNSPEDTQKKPSPKSAKPSRMQVIDNQILKAADVNSLLVVAESAVVSRRHALKMVSVLSEWSSSKKVKLSEFEKDPRFLKLCRILARTPTAQAMSSLTMAEDLSTVLGITGDDEAARLITNLTLPQMIKVMKALQQKGRRSTPLLRALSHNITRQSEVIDLKKSADLLYSMSSLNFPDPVLMDRICSDVIESLPSNDKPAVVTSIMTSLGLLKYRHEPALTALAAWAQAHRAVPPVAHAVVTLATVGFVPPDSDHLFKLAASLKEEEMPKASTWLDLVYALATLNKAEPHHLNSVLRPEFIDKLLSTGAIPIPSRRKLMQLDALSSLSPSSLSPCPRLPEYVAVGVPVLYAKEKQLYVNSIMDTFKKIPIPSRRKLMQLDALASLSSPASSPRLPEDVAVGVPVLYAKEKQLYVNSIMDTFKSLVSAEAFLKKNCNSGMGFLYDAEFAVDAKCHPVPLEKAAKDKSTYRIAVLGLDYHDMTRKVVSPLGLFQLYTTLLQLKGYKVLHIPYTEYNPKDKLVTRVQYIEKRIKQLVADHS